MPLTYINHKKATLSKDELTQLGKEFNRINSKLSGPGDEEVFFYTQQMEEPNKSEPIEVFIRLSKHLTDKRGGLRPMQTKWPKKSFYSSLLTPSRTQ